MSLANSTDHKVLNVKFLQDSKKQDRTPCGVFQQHQGGKVSHQQLRRVDILNVTSNVISNGFLLYTEADHTSPLPLSYITDETGYIFYECYVLYFLNICSAGNRKLNSESVVTLIKPLSIGKCCTANKN
jgi:hypothetical protein